MEWIKEVILPLGIIFAFIKMFYEGKKSQKNLDLKDKYREDLNRKIVELHQVEAERDRSQATARIAYEHIQQFKTRLTSLGDNYDPTGLYYESVDSKQRGRQDPDLTPVREPNDIQND